MLKKLFFTALLLILSSPLYARDKTCDAQQVTTTFINQSSHNISITLENSTKMDDFWEGGGNNWLDNPTEALDLSAGKTLTVVAQTPPYSENKGCSASHWVYHLNEDNQDVSQIEAIVDPKKSYSLDVELENTWNSWVTYPSISQSINNQSMKDIVVTGSDADKETYEEDVQKYGTDMPPEDQTLNNFVVTITDNLSK